MNNPDPELQENNFDETEEITTVETKIDRRKQIMQLILAVLVLVAGIVGIVFLIQWISNGSDDIGSSTTDGGGKGPGAVKKKAPVDIGNKSRPKSCSPISSGDRLLMYWQTEMDGCEDIPDGVTHVLLGFAQVGDGTSTVARTFQGNDETTKRCIKKLQTRCIYVMASIGGATNKKNMGTITEPLTFANSVKDLIDEFDLDGVDIDDESVGGSFNGELVVNYMIEVNRVLKPEKGQNYILTFAEYPQSLNPTLCTSDFLRCFPKRIAPLVDWVNIMSYNFDKDPAGAAAAYDGAITDIFPRFIEAMGGDAARVNLGTCVDLDEDQGGGGCGWGPGPSDAVVDRWTTFGKKAGGMFVYAGSADQSNSKGKYAITNRIIAGQGK